MKKAFSIFIILLVIIIAVFLLCYFQGAEKHSEKENLLPGPEEQEIFLTKDDFTVLLPEGWKETTGTQGVSAMVVHIDEEITDPAAKKINFRSYYSVSYDVLQGRTLENYAEYIKESLRQLLVNVNFVKEGAVEMNGRDTYTIEMEIAQQGVDFKVLMFLIKGGGDDIWLISFNTAQGYWSEYQNLFQEIAASFEIK